MRCLFINTSSFFIDVAIVDGNEVLFHRVEKIDKDMSSKIMPIIKAGFSNVNFELKNLDKIFVVNGPGSFTGVRVGVSVAKTIGWALNIDVIPVSSLEVLATTNTSKKYNVGLIDARRGNVFAGVYDEELNSIIEDQLISLDKLKTIINDKDYEIISEENNNIDVDIIKVIEKHKNDNPINPHNLNPKYLKLTEAEEKLNGSNN